MASTYPRILIIPFYVANVNAGFKYSVLSRQSDKALEYNASTAWSKEAILTLVGVCVAILGILVGLLSSPKLRQWLCKPFKCKQQIQLVSSPSNSRI
jgi:hypothetical protein